MNSIKWNKDLLAEIELSPAAVLCWQQIYLEHREAKEAFRNLAQDYPVTSEYPAMLLMIERQLLKQIGIWEELEVKFPEPLY